MEDKRIVLAEPRGFCAGVRRAIGIVERALELYGAPVQVWKESVHNHHAVGELTKHGAAFVDTEGAVSVFSAHGVSPAIRGAAVARGLDVIDATCPWWDALGRRFPHIVGSHGDDIRHAGQNRQNALTELARANELVLIVGSLDSSTSTSIRMVEVARHHGARSHCVADVSHLHESWLEDVSSVPSAPGPAHPSSSSVSSRRSRRSWDTETSRWPAGSPRTSSSPCPPG